MPPLLLPCSLHLLGLLLLGVLEVLSKPDSAFLQSLPDLLPFLNNSWGAGRPQGRGNGELRGRG